MFVFLVVFCLGFVLIVDCVVVGFEFVFLFIWVWLHWCFLGFVILGCFFSCCGLL